MPKKHSFYKDDVSKKKFSIRIPSTNIKTDKLEPFYQEVNELTTEFNKRNFTDYDKYLVNDALGIHNSRHHFVQDFN